MKHKKIFVILSIVLLIVIILLSVSLAKYKYNDQKLLLGNDINIENVDKTFVSEQMDASYLLKMLEYDASKVKEDKIIKLSVLIKNSKHIIINIGKVDILSYVSDNLSFDEEIITRKMEITLDYIDKIVKKIKKINNKSIVQLCHLSYYNEVKNENLAIKINEFNMNLSKIANNNGIIVYPMISFYFQ